MPTKSEKTEKKTGPETLVAALARIGSEVKGIEKKGRIKGFGQNSPSYTFTRDVDVLSAFRGKLSAAGIVIVPEAMERLDAREIVREGKASRIVESVRASWLATDSVDELRWQTFGQGEDTGDKALAKAQTLARKYSLMQLFQIVTGDDPDEWQSADRGEDADDGETSGNGRPTSSQQLREAAAGASGGEAAEGGLTELDFRRLFGVAREKGITDKEQLRQIALRQCGIGIESLKELDRPSYDELLAAVRKLPNAEQQEMAPESGS